MATIKAFTADGLFICQSPAFFELVGRLAREADGYPHVLMWNSADAQVAVTGTATMPPLQSESLGVQRLAFARPSPRLAAPSTIAGLK